MTPPIPSPFQGSLHFMWRNRWLAPPANFREPSGLKRQTQTQTEFGNEER